MRILLTVCALLLTSSSIVLGQKEDPAKIEITEPVVSEAQESLKIAFKVTGASKKRVRVKVDCGVDAITSKEIGFANDGEHVVSVNLFKGKNTITLIGFVNDVPMDTLMSPIVVKCSGRWCKDAFSLTSETVASEFKESVGPSSAIPSGRTLPSQGQDQKPTETTGQKGSIHITSPKSNVHYQDVTSVPLNIKVDQGSETNKNVKSIFITVLNEEKPVSQKDVPLEIKFPTDDAKKAAELTANVKIGKGKNVVLVFDPTRPDAERDSIEIACDGEKCGGGPPKVAGNISIEKPKAAKFQDATFIDSTITVKKSAANTKKLFVRVINDGRPVEQVKDRFDLTYDGDIAKLTPQIRIGKGPNTITVFDADQPFEKADQDSGEGKVKDENPECFSEVVGRPS